MNKLFSSLLMLMFTSTMLAQITDTVSQSASYANQIWYSLDNDEQGIEPKNNWHLAFETAGISSSVHVNIAIGTTLWLVPGNDTTMWATLDTTGMESGWLKCYNSAVTWSQGAFNAPANPNDDFDLGWGTYNMITHTVNGNRLFVIKVGSDFQKIWIKSLSGGKYTFRHAGLDNSMDIVHTVLKASYNTKNFVYYNLQTHQIVDREPVSDSWDLTFLQYNEFIPNAYLVTGVLTNKNVQAVKVYPVNDPAGYQDWSQHSFDTTINAIGYDWKSFNMSTFQFDIADSTVYFVSARNGAIWKLIFKDFGGSANGNYIFEKEKISMLGINDQDYPNHRILTYPNPSHSETISLFITSSQVFEGELTVYNLSGKQHYHSSLHVMPGLNSFQISASGWVAGMYLLVWQNPDGIQTTKVIIE